MVPRRYVAAALLVGGLAGHARADRNIEIVTRPERPLGNRLLLAGLIGGGALAGGLGVYFHLESRDAANAVSADGATGRAWSADDRAQVDRAADNRGRAVIAYSVGGGLVIAAIVTALLTEPDEQTTVIVPRGPAVTPTVMPAEGGAVLGGAWRF
jgi:hypothetical protein